MRDKRIVAARTNTGHIALLEQDMPELLPGTVLVEVHNSLVSPGSGVGGWRAMRDRLAHPEPLAKPRPFGYSNAGVVLAAGDGVEEFAPGDRVGCIGIGYALHTDYARVPHNLCVSLPDGVTFAQGAYAMLTTTAQHCLRRGQPELGEYVAVVGLGLVGQLTAQFYQLAGCYVIGWDVIPSRLEIARQWGIHGTMLVGEQDEVAETWAFTRGEGIDAAVLAFGGDGNAAFQSLRKCFKMAPDGHPYGRMMVVGNPRFEWTSGPVMTNVDIRQSSRTGPGYHDEEWEVGAPYPPVFMRWTTQSNLRLSMRLIAEGKLDVDTLTTHTIPLEDVDAGVAAALEDPDGMLGVLFEMKH